MIMAIGKVGSFATVEPALVDFGSMAERNIDKIKAEEEAKAAAKAKAKKEDLKEAGDVDAFKLSGFSGWDDSLGTYVSRLHQLSIDNKELYRQTGDRKYLDNYDRIKNEVNTINNESKAIGDKLKQIADLYSAGKINKTVYEEKIKEFQSLNEGKAKYAYRDGRTVIGFPDEEGNIVNESTAFGFVTNLANDMPEPFNINENINTIVEKVKASEIEAGGALYSKTITDIRSPESAPQMRRLEAAAKLFSDQNSSMTEWYLLKRDSERAKGNKMPLKTSNWTEDEKKEAKKFFLDQMIDSYQKKVSIQAQQPREGGSGGDKEKLKPTIFNPSAKFDYAPGQGISYSGNSTDSPVLGSFMVDRTLSDGSKKRIQITNATIKNIFIDKNGNVKMFYDELTGNLSEREIQDKMNDIDDLLGLGRISEGEAKKQKETLKTQSSKTKGTQELVIRRTDEDLLGMIANSMNFGSTSELLNRLDELGGRKEGSKGGNKKVNLNASSRIKK
jgi:hypothetical protein